MSLALPAMILAGAGSANAQRKNTTSHDVRRAEIPAYDPASEQPNIPDAISNNSGKIKKAANNAADAVSDAYNNTADAVSDAYDKTADTVSDAYDKAGRKINRAMGDNNHDRGGWHADKKGHHKKAMGGYKDGKMNKNVRYNDGSYKDGKKWNCGCHGDKNCMGNCMKKMNKNWVADKTADIQEDYNEAVQKINQSNFSSNQKELLMKQARENQDLAVEQLKDRADLRMKHSEQRLDMNMGDMMGDKANYKAVKKVMKIK